MDWSPSRERILGRRKRKIRGFFSGLDGFGLNIGASRKYCDGIQAKRRKQGEGISTLQLGFITHDVGLLIWHKDIISLVFSFSFHSR